MSAAPTSTIAASSRIAGRARLTRWTATVGAAPTDASSLADADAPDVVVAIASPANVSITNCLRMTVSPLDSLLPRRPSPALAVVLGGLHFKGCASADVLRKM
jgi:hypothetical protein